MSSLFDYIQLLSEDTNSINAMKIKDKFCKDYNKAIGKRLIKKSQIQQHHKFGNRSKNDSFDDMIYLYSPSGNQVSAHKYIHAKNLVDNYICEDVYILFIDKETGKANNHKLTKEELNNYARYLANNNDAEVIGIKTEDEDDKEAIINNNEL